MELKQLSKSVTKEVSKRCFSDGVIVKGFYDRNNKLVEVLCNVYMPFNDSEKTFNTYQYIDTIGMLQSVMDKYSAECPVKMVGDFNTHSCHSQSLVMQLGINQRDLISIE